ncbi:C39 family peptidase [Proteiniborus sp.]|uniref:C39 family peptidase n=1 Tax=Proteiniborus sp. TaxID=2079015 RepID=UPI00331F36AA
MDNYKNFKNLKEISFREINLINKDEDFYNGFGRDVYINNKREIMLEENNLEGTYESPIINTLVFKDLIGSWNAEAANNSEIEFFIQVKQGEEWSRWFSYGKWWSSGNIGSINNQYDHVAIMDVDLIKVLSEHGANAFRYKINLKRESITITSPKVKLIAITLNLNKIELQAYKIDRDWEMELDLPQRSQMIVPNIGNVICSPTALSMVLEYYGYVEETKKVAKGVFDNGAGIYGNWSYNVAYAGSKGFIAYVARFTDLDQIKAMISQGKPLVASIRTNAAEELQGAPQAYPSGHLIAIRGFMIKDGIEYIIVNDPAALDDESVRREYLSEQFLKAWNGVVYCVFPRNQTIEN